MKALVDGHPYAKASNISEASIQPKPDPPYN